MTENQRRKLAERENYKQHAMKAAKELGYGESVVRQIKAAETDAEIERIMIKARKEKFE